MTQQIQHTAVAKMQRSKRKNYTKKHRRAQRQRDLLESYQPRRLVRRVTDDDR